MKFSLEVKYKSRTTASAAATKQALHVITIMLSR